MRMGVVIVPVLLSVALAPIASKAADADDETAGRKACMMDALTVCAKFIPDRERIASCLKSNSERISEPCRLLVVNAH
jgi:hypothetical protein